MKVSFCGIGNVSFIAAEQVYVARVLIQIEGGNDLPPHHRSNGYDLELTVRIAGDWSWPFTRVHDEILAKAKKVLATSLAHVDGATHTSIAEYNAAEEARAAEVREATISSIFAGEPN